MRRQGRRRSDLELAIGGFEWCDGVGLGVEAARLRTFFKYTFINKEEVILRLIESMEMLL